MTTLRHSPSMPDPMPDPPPLPLEFAERIARARAAQGLARHALQLSFARCELAGVWSDAGWAGDHYPAPRRLLGFRA